MDEEITAFVIGSDEAEALLVVEPLHRSSRHVMHLSCACAVHYCNPSRHNHGPAPPAHCAQRYQRSAVGKSFFRATSEALTTWFQQCPGGPVNSPDNQLRICSRRRSPWPPHASGTTPVA